MSWTAFFPASRLGRLGLLFAVAALVAVSGAPVVPARAQGALAQLQTDVDQITRRARPSLVTVLAQSTVKRRRPPRGGQPTSVHTRIGSGVAVGESEVLTTASVVLGAERVLVRTANGIQVEAQIAGMDEVFNLALLRVPDVRLPPLPVTTARSPQVGDWAITLGTSYRLQPTQSIGNIAYLDREPRFARLQLTNSVYPGNSGGAAVSTRGELIGVILGEATLPAVAGEGPLDERRPVGSVVLSMETVRPVLEALKLEGRVPHGLMGLSTRLAEVESQTQPGLRVPIGALVEAVAPKGPADLAGLRPGDLVVGFDGERVEYPQQLARWVTASRPGTAVDLVWVRDELQQRGRVVLGEAPATTPWWATGDQPLAPTGAPKARVAELEQRIERLSREIQRLKGGKDE